MTTSIDVYVLNADEARVLEALRQVPASDEDGSLYQCFTMIGTHARLDRRDVRRACRSLRRRGLAEFASGLSTEDGQMAGSGYRASARGHDCAYEVRGTPSPRRDPNWRKLLRDYMRHVISREGSSLIDLANGDGRDLPEQVVEHLRTIERGLVAL